MGGFIVDLVEIFTYNLDFSSELLHLLIRRGNIVGCYDNLLNSQKPVCITYLIEGILKKGSPKQREWTVPFSLRIMIRRSLL